MKQSSSNKFLQDTINQKRKLGPKVLQQNFMTIQNFFPKNDQQEQLEDNQIYQGYEVSVKISKKNSFDEAYKDKLIQFINKFYFNGHFQLLLYFPHKFGMIQKEDLQNEFKDLQLEMKQIQFDKSDYLFYQKIYQFQGQEKFEISPAKQILIFDQFKFKELSSKAQESGYHFECNYQKLQCSIPTPNNTICDLKEQMKFFVNNVQCILEKYEIIEVETLTKQESIIKYNLVKQQREKISKFLNAKIFPVIINLDNLKQDSSKYLDHEFIQKINQSLKYDRFYLVVEKNDSDLNLIYQEFKKFMINKQNIYYQSEEKQIQFKEAQETDQQLENLQKEFPNISIQVSSPKQIQKNQFEINLICETWQDSSKVTSNFTENCSKIYSKLFQIYNPHVQISMKDQSTIQIWQDYLKSQLDKSLNEHITEVDQQSNRNEANRMFIIKISTNLLNYEEEKKRIKQNLENLQLSYVDIINDNQQLQKIMAEYLKQDDFEKMLNSFQKQEKDKIAQIKLSNISNQKLQFRIIFYNKYSINEIENIIKINFISDLKLKSINFPFLSIISYLKLETPQLLIEKEILTVIPQGNKHQVFVIGRTYTLQQFEENIKDIEKKKQDHKMKIQLIIKYSSLADVIIKKLQTQKFCETSYDQKKCILTIEFFSQDFETICNNLKDLEQSYQNQKVVFLEGHELKNSEIKIIEKNEQVIIDIQSFPIINPFSVEGFFLDVENNKKIKFIKGNISQISCQAIVIDCVKNIDLSKELLQNDQIKNIVNLFQGNNKTQLLQQLKQQSLDKDLQDVISLELQNHNHLHYLFQIHPKFYRQSTNLINNLSHMKSLIQQVFQNSLDYNITQIAFSLIQYELFGYSLDAVQQVLIEEIITQLSLQKSQIQQVFVVIQNESDYKQVQNYCKNIKNQTTIFNQTHAQGNQNTQLPCCKIEIDGDLINIEDSSVNELINIKLQQLNQGEPIEPFQITQPFSKYPFTHSIDIKNNIMIQKKNNIKSKIQFVDLFKQRIYFIDQQQVSQSLNQYLVIKHEQSKQSEFEINYTQDEVIVKNSSLFIKTNGFDDFKQIIIKYDKQKHKNTISNIPIHFHESDQQVLQMGQNEQKSKKLQLVILSASEQKNIMIMNLLVPQQRQPQRLLKKPI